MNIKLHTDQCMTCGLCTATAPTVFSIDTGVVSLKKDASRLSDDEKKSVNQAAADCPGNAIEVT